MSEIDVIYDSIYILSEYLIERLNNSGNREVHVVDDYVENPID